MTTEDNATPTAVDDAQAPGSWRELFSAAHVTASVVLAGGVAVYAMNTFVTASLLPTTVAEIGGAQYFAWVTTSFMVASVLTSMLVARTLAARGSARSYLLAFLLFAAGSVMAALAPGMEILLAARALQGLGGGLLAGLGYAVIREALPKHLWTRATGLVSAMWGVGTLIGPALGGVFAQLDAWRAAFWLLAAIAVVFGIMSLRGLPSDGRAENFGAVPVGSLILLAATAAAFSLAAVVDTGWPAVVAVASGVVLLGVFVLVDRASPSPVLPHLTYRRGNPLKWIYISLGILSAAAMVEMFLPKFGQELAGMSPLVAGIFGATVSIGWSFVQLVSASVDSPRRARRLTLLGPILATVGLGIYAASQGMDAPWLPWVWVGGLLLAGAGAGLAFPHLSVAAMHISEDPTEASKSAAGVGTSELIANAISSTFVGLLVVLGGPGAAGAMAMGAGLGALAALGIVTVLLALRKTR